MTLSKGFVKTLMNVTTARVKEERVKIPTVDLSAPVASTDSSMEPVGAVLNKQLAPVIVSNRSEH